MTWYERVIKRSTWNENGCLEFNGVRDKNGYGVIKYLKKNKKIHRLSYERSKGEVPKGLIVRHTCDNPSCWNPDHLLAGTSQDNTRDMFERGRGFKLRGSDHGNSKLTESQVKEIKDLLSTSNLSQREIAKMYSVTQTRISKIKLNKEWRHVL